MAAAFFQTLSILHSDMPDYFWILNRVNFHHLRLGVGLGYGLERLCYLEKFGLDLVKLKVQGASDNMD